MQKNVASQKLIVFAFDSTTNLPKTGDAANITAYVSIDYGSVTVLGDTSATEMDATNAKGYYLFDLTQAETNGNTLLFSAKSSTSNIVVIGAPAVVQTVPSSFVVAPGSANALTVAGSNAATTFSGLTTGALSCTTITASGAVAFQSTFAVTTSTSLAALSCTTLTASGAVAFQSTFAVTTSTSLAALSATTVTCSGAVAFQSTFAVTTSTSLAALSATTITASGTTSLAAVTSGTVTLNALTVTNATTLSGAVSLGSTLSVTGTTTLAALAMTTLTASGAVAFQSTFAVTTSTSLGALSCTTLTASGAVALQSTVTVTGAVLFSSTFATSGTTTFNAFTVTNVLTVSGATTLTGAVTASNASNNIVGIDVAKISGDSGAADNAESFFDGTGYAGTNNVIPTVTTLTNLPSIPANWLTAAGIAADAITAAKIADGAIDTATFAAGTTVPRCTLVDTVTAVTGLTATDVAAIKVQTDKLTFTVSNQIDANVLDWKSATAPAMTGDAFARLGAPAGASVSADVAAIKAVDDAVKAKTDNLPASPAAVGSAMTLTSAYDFAKGTVAMTESYSADGAAPTPVQALMLMLQRVTEFSIASTSITVKKLDGSTTAAVLTMDSATSPTSSTRSA